MSSHAAWQIESQEPRLHVAPSRVDSYGPDAGFICSSYGLTPDPWQQLVLDDWLGRVDGHWSSLTIGLSVPRQNGKNGVIEMREVFGMVGRGERILHTAHEVKTAQKAFRRLKHFFGNKRDDPAANFPELNALVEDVRNVNGQEAIFLRNGGSVEIVARSKNSGRGFTADTLILDEAQEMDEEDLEALLPTTSAAPSGDPQWIYTGTPPGPKAAGEVFTGKRSEALKGTTKRICWHEWSAEPGGDMDDRRQWFLANPAMGRRLSLSVAEGERANLSDEGFMRERLGLWEGSTERGWVIPEQLWRAAEDVPAGPREGDITLALDSSPQGDQTSVAACAQRADGRWQVELHYQAPGVTWVPAWLSEQLASGRVRGVVYDKQCSALASLADDFKRAGIRPTITEWADMRSACSGLMTGIIEGSVHHSGQQQLTYALSQAGKRDAEGGWAWSRRTSASDITPIVAATLALWGARNSKTKRASARARNSGRVVVLA